ncbi:MAG: glycosyl transferase, partial [Clostridium sp.]
NLLKMIRIKGELNNSIDGVSMHYSLSRDETGKTTYSLRRNRIVKRSNNFKWIGRIHEYLEVYGNIIHSDIYVHHDKDKSHTNRNLTVFRLMQHNNEEFTDRDRFYFSNELYYNGLYEEAIEQYNIFIKNGRGWIEDIKTATSNLIHCYTATNQEGKKIDAILESYKWGIPRADICCRMGEFFMNKGDYKTGAFWYKIAMVCVPDKNYMGVDIKEYYTWIPSIQLCVCYSNLGDLETAHYYNEVTASYVGDSPKVLHNRNYLRSQFEELGKEIPDYKKVLVRRDNITNSIGNIM